MSIIASVIYISGGFQNNTLKDILLLYIFWIVSCIKYIAPYKVQPFKEESTNNSQNGSLARLKRVKFMFKKMISHVHKKGPVHWSLNINIISKNYDLLRMK